MTIAFVFSLRNVKFNDCEKFIPRPEIYPSELRVKLKF